MAHQMCIRDSDNTGSVYQFGASAECRFTDSELVDTTGIIEYGRLIYLGLQRSRTDREALKRCV